MYSIEFSKSMIIIHLRTIVCVHGDIMLTVEQND